MAPRGSAGGERRYAEDRIALRLAAVGPLGNDVGDLTLAAAAAGLASVMGVDIGPVRGTVLNRNPDLTFTDPVAIADVHVSVVLFVA